MKKAIVSNGNIVQIPLSKYMAGYGYCKFLDPAQVWENDLNIPFVILIYNYITESSKCEIEEINRELLLPPMCIAGANGARKLGWTVVGNEAILEEEKFLPHVKSGWPHFAPEPERWLYFEELGNTTKQHFADYENVRHLEMNRLLNIELVPFRIVLESLKLEGKDIKDYVKGFDFLEEHEYNEVKNLQPYTTLPKELKGRVRVI